MMQPSRLRMLLRGATKRCPRCGGGNLFRHYFSMVPECPRCGLKFDREPGYWTGAIAVVVFTVDPPIAHPPHHACADTSQHDPRVDPFVLREIIRQTPSYVFDATAHRPIVEL